MAQVIATNSLSSLVQNNLNKSQKALNQSIERLSSGRRINSAKDDAAGLSIANRMTSQVNGLKQANRNANDGLSMMQTAESALGTVTDNIQRIRDLVVQAKNGTYNDENRQSINNEIDTRISEIARISGDTSFNQKTLLGSSSDTQSVNIQIGAFDGQTLSLKLMDVSTISKALKGGDGTDLTSAGNALIDADGKLKDNALTLIDTQLKAVDRTRSSLGAQQNSLESIINSNATSATNLSAARSQIVDADYAAEVSAMSTAQIQLEMGQKVLAQANSSQQNVLSLLK
ncbi:flagellin [Zymobacter sp. IVIA_5232.4 C2]|uniref:flagellin N-terminal helical domain-containing protein n=1 Tax=Zymobacter sp. IVIA_5232.4 C2 TaxID=3394855 RepID=UPI0039C35F0F